FGEAIPLLVLRRAEVGTGEDFLETKHLHAGFARALDVRNVRFEHGGAMLLARRICIQLVCYLNKTCFNDSRHIIPPVFHEKCIDQTLFRRAPCRRRSRPCPSGSSGGTCLAPASLRRRYSRSSCDVFLRKWCASCSDRTQRYPHRRPQRSCPYAEA